MELAMSSIVPPTKPLLVVSWIAQAVAALILLQTLFFKFTGAEEARYIFTTLGVEPWGRIGTGVVELVTGVLLLIPATAPIGAALGIGLMLGAIGSHLTVLGIEVKGDGGLLFGLGIVTLICCAAVLAIRRGQAIELASQLPVIGPAVKGLLTR